MYEYQRNRRVDCVELCSRGVAHALHTTRDNNVPVAEPDLLGTDDDALEAGRADLVDGRRVCLFRDPSKKSSLACGGLAYTGLEDISDKDLLDCGRRDLRVFDGLFDRDRAELWSGERLEGAVERADGCTSSPDDVDFVVGRVLVLGGHCASAGEVAEERRKPATGYEHLASSRLASSRTSINGQARWDQNTDYSPAHSLTNTSGLCGGQIAWRRSSRGGSGGASRAEFRRLYPISYILPHCR